MGCTRVQFDNSFKLVSGEYVLGEFQNPDNICVIENYVHVQEDFNGYGPEIHDAYIYQCAINIALTAPYMHNGAYRTLAEVVEFYDRGGVGLGLNVPNQTLPPDQFNLTKGEKSDLLAFLRALTDTADTQKAPITSRTSRRVWLS
jgi:hypothetical protein